MKFFVNPQKDSAENIDFNKIERIYEISQRSIDTEEDLLAEKERSLEIITVLSALEIFFCELTDQYRLEGKMNLYETYRRVVNVARELSIEENKKYKILCKMYEDIYAK